MFQKEVADRIISNFNSSKYGRLSILANWKLNIEKICDIKSNSFSPRPKVDSSLLFFKPKKNFYEIKDPKNLETVTRVLISNRRKMINKNFNKLFNKNKSVIKNLNINLNKRPEELSNEMFYNIALQYERLFG